MTARWSHVTYASFRNSDGRGGWHAGPSISAGDTDRRLVAEYAPTSLVPTEPFDDFIGAAEIDALPRRLEYLPLDGRGLFMQSVPAGKDATGRPGNVFTHAVIDHEPDEPMAATYPINLYRSPDLRTPFRAARVNNVTLGAELAEPAPGPLADLDVAWMMVRDMLGDRRGALYRLQDVLAAGNQLAVLALDNTNEAAYWLQALSATLSPLEARRLLRFSTFDRGNALPLTSRAPGTYPVVVVPTSDRAALHRRSGIAVVDPADPETFAGDPVSTWARLSAGVFGGTLRPQQVVDALIGVEETLRATPGGGLRPGDGLAHLITARPKLGETTVGAQTLAEVASQHLARNLSLLDHRNQDLELIRGVIAAPRSAVRGRNWPALQSEQFTDSEYAQLVEDAAEGFISLSQRGAAGREVIAYLDFLLRTRLMRLEQFQSPNFTDTLRKFPVLRDWESERLPAGAHPRLAEVLDLMAAVKPEEPAPRRRREPGRKTLYLLNKSNAIAAVWDWLRQPEAPEKLRQVLADEVIERGQYDYSRTLLRVYYTLDRSDRALADNLAEVIGELTTVAVTHRVNHGTPGLESYLEFGREKVAADLLRMFPDQRRRQQAVSLVRKHERPRALRMDSAVAELYAAVARGILTGLKENPGGPPTGDPQQTRKDKK